MLLRVPGYAHPFGGAAFYIHYADLYRRWRLSYFWIFNRYYLGVIGVGSVEHKVIPDLGSVNLPVGNTGSIRAPSKTIAATKFFFIYPIESAVD